MKLAGRGLLNIIQHGILAMLVTSALLISAAPAQEPPLDPETEAIAFFNKGQDAHETRDLKGAIELYEKALKLMPDFPEAELQRGNAYQSLGDLDTAESSFRRAVSLRDDWSLALANLGSLLVRRGKFHEAKPVLKRAIEMDSDNTPAHVANVTLLVKTNATETELKDAHKKIAAMSAVAKPVASVWFAKAVLENALGDKKAAAVSSSRSLELDPNNVSALAFSAVLSLDNGDPAKAEARITKIETIEPGAPEISILKARTLVAGGKTADALKFIESIKDPAKELLDLKAQIVASTSDDVGALEKQLEGEPRNAVILGRLCSVLRAKDPAKSMDYCRRAYDSEPGNLDHAVGYGAALLQAKNYAGAASLFQKLLAAAPENFTLRANLATALFQLKRYNEAKIQYQWIVERQPENAAAFFFLAVSHDQLSEYADAMANYQIFLRKADAKASQLEIDKINLRLPVLQKLLDSGKGRKNGKTKS